MNNTAITGSGGAIYNNDYDCLNDGNITIINMYSTFMNSIAADGGGALYLKFNSGNITILDATFINSAATAGGGAAYLNGGNTLMIVNSAFMNSTAVTGSGGAVYNYS